MKKVIIHSILVLLVCFQTLNAKEVNIPQHFDNNRSWYKYQFSGNWPDFSNQNCGPSVYAMIVHYMTGMVYSTTYDSIKNAYPPVSNNIIQRYPELKTEARWRGCMNNPYGHKNGFSSSYKRGTEDVQLMNALDNEGISLEMITGTKVYIDENRQNQVNLSLITAAIDYKMLVIVHVHAGAYHQNGYYSHWIVVYGYDNNKQLFYVNDPGYQREVQITYSEMKKAIKEAYSGNNEILCVIHSSPMQIGYFESGWQESISLKFVNAYEKKGRYSMLGIPFNNGGSVYVHQYCIILLT